MDEFGYKTADGHAHKCINCNEHDEVVPHAHNVEQPTDDVAKYCAVEGCGYIIKPSLSHVHEESNVWEYDETHHWHDSIDGNNQQFSMATYTNGNTDGICDTCGHVITTTPPPHTHDYGTTWKTDQNEHWHECACGEKTDVATHVDSDSNVICDYQLAPLEQPTPEGGLLGGAIAGIVGSVVVAGGGGYLLFWFVIRKRKL